jgi:Ca2+-binding EF-hand superfamily protein
MKGFSMSMNVSGIGGSFSPHAMTGASARMPPAQKMGALFSQIDTSGTGSITQSQFTQTFNAMKPTAGFRAMGPSADFQALSPSSAGTVSRQNFVQGMTQLMAQFRAGGTHTP